MMWFRNYEIYDDTGLSFISMPGLCSLALVCMEKIWTQEWPIAEYIICMYETRAKKRQFPRFLFSSQRGNPKHRYTIIQCINTFQCLGNISLSLSINIFFHCRLLKHSSVNVDMNKKGWDPLCSVCAARVQYLVRLD